MPISIPDKIITPFATSGLKDNIPQSSDPINGRAGYDQGFPPINLTPRTAGGIPPFGQDMNGIFFDVTEAVRFQQAGGSFPYDSTWATAVGGYPVGALISRTDNQGLWLNTAANNTTNPEAFGAGWVPGYTYGSAAVSMTNANVTLTALQSGCPVIVITGLLTANLNLIFPTYIKSWIILNLTTGSFSITAKTAAGSGVVVAQGGGSEVVGNGTNIYNASSSSLQIASTGQAQAWTDNTTVISPLRLSEAFKGANQTLAAASGFQKMPGGFIEQWGYDTISRTEGAFVITLPVTYPNGQFPPVCITWNATSSPTSEYSVQVVSLANLSQLSLFLQAGTGTSGNCQGVIWWSRGW